jgi:hypothetical protein
MDEEAVREYVGQAQSIIESSPQMDEANTKAAILRDFLELLGWQIPVNTQLEYSVKAFGKTYKVDYALVLEGAPVAFIEAKGVDTPLTEKHREQLAAYLKNEDVNWGILTNGQEYEFYRREVIDSKVNVNSLADIQLQSLPDRVTILTAFTKAAIQSGNSEKIATRINEMKQARSELETRKDELATEVTELLTDSVSDSISTLAESQAKEMIDRLVQDIESEIDLDSSDSPSVSAGEEISPDTVLEESSEVEGEYLVKIRKDGTTIATFADDNQSEIMNQAVDYLIENYDLISKIEPLPYVPGNEKAIINSTPTSPHDDEGMRTYRELTQGYYLDTHMNKRGKKRHLRGIAKECGLDVVFEGRW